MTKSEKPSSNFLQSMFKESDAYASMDLIESLVEKGVGLHSLPLQPLYMALKNLPVEQASTYLSKLNKAQRHLMMDIDLWLKDQLDPDEFEFWVETYALNTDEDIRSEFSQSIEFLLYLKGRFNIWTFDVEDPQYPDHDNYFLTDDSLLLFEFHDDFHLVSQVRSLIREIYSVLGVEKAYAWLFKMVSDGALTTIEEEYQSKKGRLADAGFVDYFDALQIDNPHINRPVMDNWIKKKEKVSVGVDNFAKQQVLPRNTLVVFKDQFEGFDQELAKVSDEKRSEYLRFNFLRLVNGNITLNGTFRDGAVALNRAGEKTKSCLLIGFSYLTDYAVKKGLVTFNPELSLFDLFDFSEIYRIGNSLLIFGQKDLKKALRVSKIEDDEGFVGQMISDFLDQSFDRPVKAAETWQDSPKTIQDYPVVEKWLERVEFVSGIAPYIGKLLESFVPLKSSGQIQDSFYLNYNVDDIDFESILISSFANFTLVEKGHLDGEVWDQGKLGLTKSEFLQLIKEIMTDDLKVNTSPTLELFHKYCEKFGLAQVNSFDEYFIELLESQLEGYDYPTLADEDFAHVGGPILLKSKKDLN